MPQQFHDPFLLSHQSNSIGQMTISKGKFTMNIQCSQLYSVNIWTTGEMLNGSFVNTCIFLFSIRASRIRESPWVKIRIAKELYNLFSLTHGISISVYVCVVLKQKKRVKCLSIYNRFKVSL